MSPQFLFLRLAVVAMAGLAAEGLQYDKVVGQSADLFTLQVCYIKIYPKSNISMELRICLIFNSFPSVFSETHKQEQAADSQRTAAKPYQMGCEYCV